MKRSPLKRRTSLRSGSSLRRTRLAPMSQKRKRESRIYSAKRKAFLAAHPWCQFTIERFGVSEAKVLATGGTFKVCGDITGTVHVPPATDIHHRAGRAGANYLDESTWMAVSREGHEWIHANPSEARKRGWLT